MSTLKQYSDVNVYDAAKKRVQYTFDNFDNIYLSFSGGKDSSVMFHLVMDEAIKRDRTVGILLMLASLHISSDPLCFTTVYPLDGLTTAYPPIPLISIK